MRPKTKANIIAVSVFLFVLCLPISANISQVAFRVVASILFFVALGFLCERLRALLIMAFKGEDEEE